MYRWSKKDLENISNIDFAIAILNERRNTLTNPYSYLSRKIAETISELQKIKEAQK